MTKNQLDAETDEKVAQVCHEANRAWCAANGDFSQAEWGQAPEWQRASAREGVSKARQGATPGQLHESWSQAKLDAGWRYGDIKDADAKTHPCLVPYDELPEEQRCKDALFAAIVGALA